MDDDSRLAGLPDAARMMIDTLGLQPHPEGGWFTETFRDAGGGDGAARSTAIYYLLARGERSHWHRVTNAVEIWHHYAGHPLRLSTSADGVEVKHHLLGGDVAGAELPQIVVAQGHWQSAEPLGDWTLVGCTVAPGFDFDAFELAPQGWAPGP